MTMPVTGGGSRKDLAPLERRDRSVLGSHRRQYEGLNVPNPQPGRVYVHVRNAEGPIRRSLNEGAHFVKEGDPEAMSMDPEELPLSMRSSLDSLRPFGDVVLMWKSDEVVRRQTEELLERNRAALEGAEADYLQEGERIAAEIGSANPLRYANRKRGHGYYVERTTEER